MSFGTEVVGTGQTTFRVWAPEAPSLQLELCDSGTLLDMQSVSNGCYELTADAPAGARYRYILPNGLRVPDPASRFQPEDTDGPSMVIDPRSYSWQDLPWKGRPWEEAVLYELHIGTFTPEGTFRAAIAKLDHLLDLGVTAVEIMAIGDFAGARGWGYDGVLMYAPDSAYGTPDDLKALVDAAHARGLMVILDVVYNHFGPEGNYLPQLFPDICTNRYTTPWGQALNFDAKHSEKTREFIIHNALYWIEEFRMDGLRLDAVHAIIDSSSTHILDELAHRVHGIAGDRQIHLILESDDTVWHRLIRDSASMPLLSTAQWNHDSRELAHAAITASQRLPDDLITIERLGRALVEGFTSEPPKFGSGHDRVPAPVRIPPSGFISFLQTHDLIGNRLRGERLNHLAPANILDALRAIYLLLPQIPMLFMGEEWAASTPFPYFCDFDGDLAEAIRWGRLEQFTTSAERGDAAFLASIPDPVDEQTFLSAKLRWSERVEQGHAETMQLYRDLLRTRRDQIIPRLRTFVEENGTFQILNASCLQVQWKLNGGALRLDLNLSGEQSAHFAESRGHRIWLQGTETSSTHLGPWSVRWTVED